jgi:hypothetical protein
MEEFAADPMADFLAREQELLGADAALFQGAPAVAAAGGGSAMTDLSLTNGLDSMSLGGPGGMLYLLPKRARA